MGLSNYINNIIRENEGFEIMEIYNLGAQSNVKVSYEIPEYTTNVDGLGSDTFIRNTPYAAKCHKRIKYAFIKLVRVKCLGDVLEMPQTEKTPFNPVSPYAAAKLYAHHMVKIL